MTTSNNWWASDNEPEPPDDDGYPEHEPDPVGAYIDGINNGHSGAAALARALGAHQETEPRFLPHLAVPDRVHNDPEATEAPEAKPPKAQPNVSDSTTQTFGAIKLADLSEPSIRGRFRFCTELGWLMFDGSKWANKAELHALAAIAEVVRRYTADIVAVRGLNKEECKEIAGFSGPRDQRHALVLLCTREGVATDYRLFDAPPAIAVGQPWTIPCSNGFTVELYADGGKKVRRTSPDDLNTMTACAYDPDATAPSIAAAFKLYQPDEDVRRYQMQMWCRGLSGLGAENFIANLGKGGGNGKGTMAGLLKATFGDYAQQIPVQVILAARTDNMQMYRSELAGLRGKRYVFCEEPKEGARYDEGMVKLLTGGGEVTGRSMNRDGVTFSAKWLFEMAANTRPSWSADDAITRRYVEISWDFSIVETKSGVQEGFKERLKSEASGFLNAILAQWTGEAKPVMPAKVTEQTMRGNEAASPLAEFVRQALIRSDDGKAYAGDLYQGYLAWSKTAGPALPMSATKFGLELPRCGIPKQTDRRGTFYAGATLKEQYESGQHRHQ